ncbi:GNAT family N-acetyltransferase [Pseudochrobactrum lubricantis]|uniref:GNAT family N-acetyltransferase n=1 Tax=Pseudochrobactrum lubricantis TaxID=558172 RepID=UPI0035DEEDC7
MTTGILSRPLALDNTFRSHLRLVEPDDAAFICELRADPRLNRHLSKSSPEVEAQKAWIENYKQREAAGSEYYFVIHSDGADCGVVRMYDFQENSGSFCWGSWIIKQPAPISLAPYTAALIYELGFDVLGFEQSHFDVRKENEKVCRFHLRTGAIRVGETELDQLFVFKRESWPSLREASERHIRKHRVSLK